mmetsp:Transcript_26915/g.68402  ORF Transcript_26915/g.68402 Transcript_26915/m.68402 type:complete len:524 (-) Transcript_26915:631-2202(-)
MLRSTRATPDMPLQAWPVAMIAAAPPQLASPPARGRPLVSRPLGMEVPLGPGVVVPIAGRSFHISGPLGEGSFGIVWAAKAEESDRLDADEEFAIKEILCKSRAELLRVAAEGQLLELATHSLAGHCLRVPRLVVSEATPRERGGWLVRLGMTRLPGNPLEQHLERQRAALKRRSPGADDRFRFAEACRYAGELLCQLAPTLEAFSCRVYHRDVTPRNILLDERRGTNGRMMPHFSLVDFGLAVDAAQWRSEEQCARDLGGDGRYWPASAWLVFSHGAEELDKHQALRHEYRTCLDVHSLGISALRCLMELLPNVLEPGAEPPASQDALYGDAMLPKLRSLRAAWSRYWSDARRFWQPIFEAFQTGGDFEALRAAYIGAGVYRIMSADLCALHEALFEARQACESAPPETGLSGMPALFEALLLMVQPGRLEDEAARPEARNLPSDSGPCGAGFERITPKKEPRSSSHSTGTPDTSPSCSSSSGESDKHFPSPPRSAVALPRARCVAAHPVQAGVRHSRRSMA